MLVEGPIDAIAVTTATGGACVGLAPCGTALSEAHGQLIAAAVDLPARGRVIATDTDPSSGVYFTALSTMLSITRASSSGSPKTTTGVVPGRSKWSRTPACLARMLSRSTLASHSSAMSTARRTVSRLPWIRE